MPSLNDIFGPLVAQETPDIKGQYYDPAVGFRIGSTLTDWDALVAKNKLANAAFATKYGALTPRLDALANTDVSYYSDLLKKATERNPLVDYRTILDTSFDKIGGVGKTLSDYGSAADKLASANLGLGGRNTTYDAELRANRIARNLAPLYGTALSTAPGVYSDTLRDYYANLGVVPSLMAGRYSALENTAGRELVPTAVERSNLAANLDLLNKIGTMNKDAQYFWRRPSDLETYGGIFSNLENSTKQDIGNAARTVGSMYGLGGGGIDLSKISSLFASQPAQPVGGYNYMGNWNPNQVGNGGWANGVPPQNQGMNWINTGGQQSGGGGGGGL